MAFEPAPGPQRVPDLHEGTLYRLLCGGFPAVQARVRKRDSSPRKIIPGKKSQLVLNIPGDFSLDLGRLHRCLTVESGSRGKKSLKKKGRKTRQLYRPSSRQVSPPEIGGRGRKGLPRKVSDNP